MFAKLYTPPQSALKKTQNAVDTLGLEHNNGTHGATIDTKMDRFDLPASALGLAGQAQIVSVVKQVQEHEQGVLWQPNALERATGFRTIN